MGLFTRFVTIITCRGCTASDEKVLERRNKLRNKLGKNKIVPQAQTDVDIKAERIQTTRKESPTSLDIFTVEKKKDEIVVGDKEQTAVPNGQRIFGGDVNTGGVEKAGGDAPMYEFALNYVKTLVIPGAMERYMAEQDRDQHNVSVASTGGSSGISMAVSDFVRVSLANAHDLLKQEQMLHSGTEQIEDVRYNRNGATGVVGALGEKQRVSCVIKLLKW